MTNAIASLVSSTLSMTSQEIAELTGKENKNVIADIRTMLAQLSEIDGLDFSHVLETKDSRGYTSSFSLPKDLTLTLVSGYSAPMRHKIVCRWLELEAEAPAFKLPQTFAEALLLAGESQKKLEAAQKQITMDAPKVALHDTVVGYKEQTISEMIRKIEPRANQNMVRKDLIRLGYLYSKAGQTRVYAKYLGTMFKEGSVNTNGDRSIFALADGKVEMMILAEAGKFTMKK